MRYLCTLRYSNKEERRKEEYPIDRRIISLIVLQQTDDGDELTESMMTTARVWVWVRVMDGKKGRKKEDKETTITSTAVMVVIGKWCDVGVARTSSIPTTAQRRD